MDNETRVKSILSNFPFLMGEDLKSIKSSVEKLIEEGWKNPEIICFCRLTEEVDPLLDEDTALMEMKLLRDRVKEGFVVP